VFLEREGVGRGTELAQVQDPVFGLLRGRDVPARYPPQGGVRLGQAQQPITVSLSAG
jgi:hypothetical protein